jgi:predicted O-methyltransferase YrrM
LRDTVSSEFRTDDWDQYRMDYSEPFRRLEPREEEIATVDGALAVLAEKGILPHTDYPRDKFLAHREAVRDRFEIPWTAIAPRMERLIYAINAIARPKRMIAAGVFCGFTFICNAGAGVGPGASYEPEELLGVEIRPEEAERAERNVRRLDDTGTARVLPADAVEVVADYEHEIELLYLDADGGPEKGKGIYLDILQAAYDKLPEGALVLAHNSVNCCQRLRHYLDFVRNPENMSASVNVIFDPEGLEVSAK